MEVCEKEESLCFKVAPEGRKVGSLKRRVRSHLARWEMKSCTPLWREVETDVSEHFWKLRCRKSVRRCGAKHMSKSKCTKHTMLGPLLEVHMSKKCTPLWREAHVKNWRVWTFRCRFCVVGARDCAPCQKWAKREGFVAFPKTMAGVGHLQRICKDAFRAAGAVQETCSSEMLGG